MAHHEVRRRESCQKDLRLEMRVKNNRLYKAIHEGYGSVSEFCRQTRKAGYHFQTGRIYALLGFRQSPFTKRDPNEYTELCKNLSEMLGVLPEDLFPRHLYTSITENRRVIEVSSFSALPSVVKSEIKALPASVEESELFQLSDSDVRARILGVIETLSHRERTVLKMRFGFGEYAGQPHTPQEVAEKMGFTDKYINHIEGVAICSMQDLLRPLGLEGFLSLPVTRL